MSRAEIIRAWKDPEYRQSLSKEERSLLPAHPAGLIELHNEELGGIAGGVMNATVDLCTLKYTCDTNPSYFMHCAGG